MKIGKHGLALIKEFEGLRLKAYIPVTGDVPTIGWGHTRGVKMGDKITLNAAKILLEKDIAPTVTCVNRVVKVPLTQNQFDSTVNLRGLIIIIVKKLARNLLIHDLEEI